MCHVREVDLADLRTVGTEESLQLLPLQRAPWGSEAGTPPENDEDDVVIFIQRKADELLPAMIQSGSLRRGPSDPSVEPHAGAGAGAGAGAESEAACSSQAEGEEVHRLQGRHRASAGQSSSSSLEELIVKKAEEVLPSILQQTSFKKRGGQGPLSGPGEGQAESAWDTEARGGKEEDDGGTLESKLELLTLQRSLCAVKCEIFLDFLEVQRRKGGCHVRNRAPLSDAVPAPLPAPAWASRDSAQHLPAWTSRCPPRKKSSTAPHGRGPTAFPYSPVTDLGEGSFQRERRHKSFPSPETENLNCFLQEDSLPASPSHPRPEHAHAGHKDNSPFCFRSPSVTEAEATSSSSDDSTAMCYRFAPINTRPKARSTRVQQGQWQGQAPDGPSSTHCSQPQQSFPDAFLNGGQSPPLQQLSGGPRRSKKQQQPTSPLLGSPRHRIELGASWHPAQGGAASPLHYSAAASPLHSVGAVSPLHSVGAASPLHSVGAESPLHWAGTASPLPSVGAASPLHSMGTASTSPARHASRSSSHRSLRSPLHHSAGEAVSGHSARHRHRQRRRGSKSGLPTPAPGAGCQEGAVDSSPIQLRRGSKGIRLAAERDLNGRPMMLRQLPGTYSPGQVVPLCLQSLLSPHQQAVPAPQPTGHASRPHQAGAALGLDVLRREEQASVKPLTCAASGLPLSSKAPHAVTWDPPQSSAIEPEATSLTPCVPPPQLQQGQWLAGTTCTAPRQTQGLPQPELHHEYNTQNMPWPVAACASMS